MDGKGKRESGGMGEGWMERGNERGGVNGKGKWERGGMNGKGKREGGGGGGGEGEMK